MFASYAFLLVVFFGIIAMINNDQPISEFTMKLILFVVPTVFIFSWYASGGYDNIKVVLNRNRHNTKYGNSSNQTSDTSL